MASLTPRFSADRTVREYTEEHYLRAAAAYCDRAAGKGEAGSRIVAWRRAIEQHWPQLRFGEVKVVTGAGQHGFEAQVYLGDLDPGAVRVEMFADGEEPHEMERVRQLPGAAGGYVYRVQTPAKRAAGDYTARVIPRHDGVAVPLETARILWQR
jgi:starch phosphorylase